MISLYFGLYKVTYKESKEKHTKNLVIMNNVFKFKDFDVGIRFDLKGSQVAR